MKKKQSSAHTKQNKPSDKKVNRGMDTLTEEEAKQREEEEKRRKSQTPVNNERNSQGGIWQGPDTVPDENNPQQSVEGYKSDTAF